MTKVSVLIGLLGIVLGLTLPHDGGALTRREVLQRAQTYMLVNYDVTSANVYPSVECYRPELGAAGLSKLGIGSYTGLPYSYRPHEAFSPERIVADLFAGRGAGNSSTLLDAAWDCVVGHVTGIDCSQFVSHAWDVARFGVHDFATGTINARGQIALGITDERFVRGGDAFCIDIDWPPLKKAHHIILFSDTVGADGYFYSYEASSSDPPHVTSKRRNYDVLSQWGYHPWVSIKLKDEPASQIARFDVIADGERAVVRWTTLMEDRTASFAIARSDEPGAPFQVVSDDIPSRGSMASGADYEFVDPEPATSATRYRLLETETNGRELQYGTRSFGESVTWARRGLSRARR